MEPVVPNAEDTAGQAPPPDVPLADIEVVDTPAAPEAAPVPVAPAQPALIFGKYRTVEDAEKAYSEAQRVLHEKAQEAATYRKMLDERAAPAASSYQPPAADLDGQFREKLAENPGAVIFEAARFAARQMYDEQQQKQRELVKNYQTFASQPGYADVANEVASQLPFAHEQQINPVEVIFLKAKLAKLEQAMANGATRGVNVPHVEPAGAARRTGGLRVELDPDTAKLRGFDQQKVHDLARIVARQKSAGGTMREMSIDDWEKSNA